MVNEKHLIRESRRLKDKGWKIRDICRALCLDKKELKKYLLETKDNKKLVAPNANYEIASCETCGKEFIKRKTNSTKQLAIGIRGYRAKNCSRMCTRMSKRGKSPSINNASLEVEE